MVDLHSLNLRLDLFRCRADGVDALDPLPQQVVELCVVAVFVLASENQVDICRERFQGLDGCIHVGGLGVVVVLDATNRGHVFQPVLDRLEVADGFADARWLATQEGAHAHGSQHVLDVVASLERNLRDQHDLALTFGIPKKNSAIADIRALLDLFLAAEPEDLRPRAAGQSGTGGIVCVQNCKIFGLLVFKDARLGVWCRPRTCDGGQGGRA